MGNMAAQAHKVSVKMVVSTSFEKSGMHMLLLSPVKVNFISYLNIYNARCLKFEVTAR